MGWRRRREELVRWLVAEAVADVREDVVHLMTDGRQNNDDHDRDEDEDECVLNHALAALRTVPKAFELIINEDAAAKVLGHGEDLLGDLND